VDPTIEPRSSQAQGCPTQLDFQQYLKGVLGQVKDNFLALGLSLLGQSPHLLIAARRARSSTSDSPPDAHLILVQQLQPFFVRYVAAWLSFCGLGAGLALRYARPKWRDELAFLVVPWKLAVFVPAIVFVTFAGRFTDDETWDIACGFGMSILTVTTSGWAIGTLYKVYRKERPWPLVLPVFAIWIFASSWYYDGYLLLRDGRYTHRWLGNLMISPMIYLSAGLLINLEARVKGLGFAFTRPDWPKGGNRAPSWWLALAALPLIAIAAYLLIAAVGWHL
jgi:hypothetical protein